MCVCVCVCVCVCTHASVKLLLVVCPDMPCGVIYLSVVPNPFYTISRYVKDELGMLRITEKKTHLLDYIRQSIFKDILINV